MAGHPTQQPHEYSRDGTAKLLTLFQPTTGQLLVKGVTSTPNVILHAWLKEQLLSILAQWPQVVLGLPHLNRLPWQYWREGLLPLVTLPTHLPPLRLLLIMDNLVGHKNPEWLLGCFSHGILPLFTPLAASWLNRAESLQRLLKRRALDGTYPTAPQQFIHALESVAAHWNRHPTPFVWAGIRKARRNRAALNRLRLGASLLPLVPPVVPF